MDSKSKSFPKKLYACWHPVVFSQEIKADNPKNTNNTENTFEKVTTQFVKNVEQNIENFSYRLWFNWKKTYFKFSKNWKNKNNCSD